MSEQYSLYMQIDSESLRRKYIEAIKIYMKNEDCGFDLYISGKIHYGSQIYGKKRIDINHKIKCMVINSCTKSQHAYYLYPRSSISKIELRMCNSVGIIDAGYRGDIIAKCDNIEESQSFYDQDYDSDDDDIRDIQQYDRLFQLCTPNLSKFKLIEIIDKLPDSKRGSGGFGSTGN